MTMQTFGPYTPASGTPIKLTIPIDAAWLYVYNDSPLSILVQYDGNTPTATTSLDGSYHFAVRPHSDPVIPVQKQGVSPLERQLNGIARFGGVVYLMPRDPGGLALTGTISGRSEIFVVAGGPYDAPPAPSSTGRQFDLSSQPRVVAIPSSGGQLYTVNWNMTVGTHQTFFFNQLLTPAQIAAGVAYLYVYYLYVASELGVSPQLGASRIAAFYEMTDVNSLLIGSATNFMFFTIAQLYNTTNNSLFLKDFTYAPAQPPFIQIAVPPNAVHLFVGLQWSTGIQYTGVDVAASAALDINNVVALAPIGNNQQNYYNNVQQANSPVF